MEFYFHPFFVFNTTISSSFSIHSQEGASTLSVVSRFIFDQFASLPRGYRYAQRGAFHSRPCRKSLVDAFASKQRR
jgi:hypothetical protein